MGKTKVAQIFKKGTKRTDKESKRMTRELSQFAKDLKDTLY